MLPPSGEVARSADRGSHVILSVSEISHDQSEKVQTLRKFTLPGDCFVVSLPRNDKQKMGCDTRHIPFQLVKKVLTDFSDKLLSKLQNRNKEDYFAILPAAAG